MADGGGRRDILQKLDDNKLIKHYEYIRKYKMYCLLFITDINMKKKCIESFMSFMLIVPNNLNNGLSQV